MNWTTIFAIIGALTGTVLAVIRIIEFFRQKGWIKLTASILISG